MEKTLQGDIATSYIVRLDECGRIVFPMALRRYFDIQHGDYIGFQILGDTLIVRKIGDPTTSDVLGIDMRRVDNLGRIAIPPVFRRCYGIIEGVYLDITVDPDNAEMQFRLHLNAYDAMQYIETARRINQWGYENVKTRQLSVAIDQHLDCIEALLEEQTQRLIWRPSQKADSKASTQTA